MYSRQSPWDFYSLVMACKWHSVSVRQPNSGLVYETNFLKNLGKMWYFFLLCMKFTSLPFTRGLQGKNSQRSQRAILLPVAAPLQNLPSVSRVALGHREPSVPSPISIPKDTCWAPHWALCLKHSPPEPSFRQETRRDALNCPVEDPLSLSFIQDTRKPDKVGILKSLNRNPTHSLQGWFFFLFFFSSNWIYRMECLVRGRLVQTPWHLWGCRWFSSN